MHTKQHLHLVSLALYDFIFLATNFLVSNLWSILHYCFLFVALYLFLGVESKWGVGIQEFIIGTNFSKLINWLIIIIRKFPFFVVFFGQNFFLWMVLLPSFPCFHFVLISIQIVGGRKKGNVVFMCIMQGGHWWTNTESSFFGYVNTKNNCEGYHSCMVVLASLGKENKKRGRCGKKIGDECKWASILWLLEGTNLLQMAYLICDWQTLWQHVFIEHFPPMWWKYSNINSSSLWVL
jgi:hypothetical protein